MGLVFELATSQHSYSSQMAELGLKKKEVEAIDFAFDVYDFKGDGNVDAFYAGDLLRACNLNPTLKTIAEIGGESEKGKKMLRRPRCTPSTRLPRTPRTRVDSTTSLRSWLYDKNNDDTMMGHELFRLLTNLGEKLNKEEAKNLIKELCEPEDDDGFMPFKPFLERMCSNE